MSKLVRRTEGNRAAKYVQTLQKINQGTCHRFLCLQLFYSVNNKDLCSRPDLASFNRPVQSSCKPLDSTSTGCQRYYKLNWVQILLVSTPDVKFYLSAFHNTAMASARQRKWKPVFKWKRIQYMLFTDVHSYCLLTANFVALIIV